MDIKKCNKGHFYNASKFSECPHCKEEQGVGQSDMLVGGTDMTILVPHPPVQIGKKRNDDLPPTVAYVDPDEKINPYAQRAVQSLPPTGEQPTFVKGKDSSLAETIKQAYEQNDMQSKGMVVGWLVGVGGPKYGRVHTLYTSDTTVENVVISFDMYSKLFVLNFTLSKNDVMINGRGVVENEYLNYMDRIFINGTDYMLVTLCKDGFSWWQTSAPSRPEQQSYNTQNQRKDFYSNNAYGQESQKPSEKLKFTFVDNNYNASFINAQMNEVQDDDPATSVLVSNTWRCLSCNAANSEMVSICRLCETPRWGE